jgi:predicted Zn-dependent protease
MAGVPALALTVFYEWAEKDPERALRALDCLETTVGKDAFLLSLRSKLFRRLGRLEDARAAARKAVSDEPDLEEGFWALLDVALARKDWAEAIQWLERLETEFAVDLEAELASKEYAEFLASEEARIWRDTRPAKGGSAAPKGSE